MFEPMRGTTVREQLLAIHNAAVTATREAEKAGAKTKIELDAIWDALLLVADRIDGQIPE